jgi:hypothetical protein
MPTISKYVEVTSAQLENIAKHVENWIETTGTTHEEFARLYNEMKDRRYPGPDVARMNRWRVLGYLNVARRGSGSHMAKVPRCKEVELLALLIRKPVEVLLGGESESSLHLANPAATTADAARFLELLGSRQAETQELIGWAEFLPCSLETPEFMHAHHEALFDNNPGDVMGWDAIGNSRRNDLLRNRDRRWRMTQLNFLSDLKKIAQGTEEYESISPRVRKECIDNLIRLLLDDGLRIRMLIADDEGASSAGALRIDLGQYDSAITWDEKLMVVRDHWGITYYSDRPRYAKYWRGMQEEFIAVAQFSKPQDVVTLLRDLSREIPGVADVEKASTTARKEKRGSQWARQQ